MHPRSMTSLLLALVASATVTLAKDPKHAKPTSIFWQDGQNQFDLYDTDLSKAKFCGKPLQVTVSDPGANGSNYIVDYVGQRSVKDYTAAKFSRARGQLEGYYTIDIPDSDAGFKLSIYQPGYSNDADGFYQSEQYARWSPKC